MSFSLIAIRANSPVLRITKDWFNSLRAAGAALEALLGPSLSYSAAPVALANNQVGAADVTGLLFDKTVYKTAMVIAEIRRKTADNEAVAHGKMSAIYRDNTDTWELVPTLDGDGPGDGAGVTFSMNGEQVQYVSDNMAGADYIGNLQFKILTSFGV